MHSTLHTKNWILGALTQELYGGALERHFRVEKSCAMLNEHYYWPKTSKHVEHYVKRCSTCQLTKSHLRPKAFTLHFQLLKALGRM